MTDEEREARQKWKELSKKDFIKNFIYYYKVHMLAAVCLIILLIYTFHEILTPKSDCVLSATFINWDGKRIDDITEPLAEYLSKDSQPLDISLKDTLIIDPGANASGESESAARQILSAMVMSREIDIIAADKPTFDYCARSGYFLDLDSVLPDEFKEKYKDLFYYSKDNYGNNIISGIAISDSPVMNELLAYTKRTAYAGIAAGSDNIENAIAFLNFLYND